MTHEGTVDLAADGSARLEIDQRYEGKLAIALRTALEQLPEARFKEIIESRLLPQSLPGARVVTIDVKNLAELDEPLVLHMKLEMSSFARPRSGELLVSPLFPLRLGALTQLASRETPLYIAESIATRLSVKLRIKLPEGARVVTALEPASLEDETRLVTVEGPRRARLPGARSGDGSARGAHPAGGVPGVPGVRPARGRRAPPRHLRHARRSLRAPPRTARAAAAPRNALGVAWMRWCGARLGVRAPRRRGAPGAERGAADRLKIARSARGSRARRRPASRWVREPSDIVSNGRRQFGSASDALASLAMLDTDRTTLTEVLTPSVSAAVREGRRP